MAINPNKNLLGVNFKGSDLPIPEPTAKGLADGSLTSFSAPALGVTSLKSERFRGFTSLQTLDLTGITDIPAYTAYGCSALTSLILNNPVTNVGESAFESCGSVNTNSVILTGNNANIGNNAFKSRRWLKDIEGTFTNIGGMAFDMGSNLSGVEKMHIKVNGAIQGYALRQNHVSDFYLDPTSNITTLGDGALQSIGNRRPNPENNIFTFDFRNSSFTSIGFTFGTGGSSGARNLYFDIYFPETLTRLSNSVFEDADHFNIYYKRIPNLANTNNFSRATNFKNFFPYNLVQTAKTSTNWSSSTNNIVSSIYGYAAENTFSLGDTLPDTDTDGYALTWYSDIAMTQQVTTVSDPTQMYYCAVGSRIKVPLSITQYQATCTLSDGVNTYTNGSMVPIGDTVTITAVGDTGYPDPYTFTLNGTTIASGDTYTILGTDTILNIICIYYDGVNPPVEPVFANNTPQQIKIAVDNGLHRTLWSIGDTRVITLTNNQQVTMRYIDQVANRYQKSDNSGYTNAVFEFTTLPMTAQMNTSGTNAGGWPASRMNTVTMPQIYDLLPSDWKAVFSQGRIPSATSGNDSTIVYADNVSFIPSGQEMYGNSYVTNYYYDEGCVQFDYYRINSANSYKIKQYNGTNTRYWLRSPFRSYSNVFCYVITDGSINSSSAGGSNGVSVCLII